MPPGRIVPLKPKQIVAALQRAGFRIHHQKGSHARLLHADKPDAKVTIPVHNKDLPASFIKHRILKQAQLSEAEFLSYL